ncbi:Thiol oxidoreductase-like protein [Nitrospira japonica]|uniref:Thiol oxidoreductase-like protein n=1 Tax=Nitrospira japonica TaxID=1325564 RepID=A0A1W1I179_9BACT|nr:di-heme oxidoredictase family protein [Nitrospira japonica]SLM46755.1 Thiol oxidoreductase-like protein [Nitrospira japonica]
MLSPTPQWTRLLAISVVMVSVSAGFLLQDGHSQTARITARDPGVRTGPAGSGQMLSGLTALEQRLFSNSRAVFQEVQSVQGTIANTEAGLGPRFNLDSCAGCHSNPDVGGSSPAVNPQVDVAKKEGAVNEIPSFIKRDGPIREARFKLGPGGTPDGGVQALFTITGRHDAAGCSLPQPDFRTAVAARNVIFRIPTPLFGSGLIEAIDDDTILANIAANSPTKQSLGIVGRANRTTGHPNTSGNDGTITRFGWKAQNKSLEVFSGEAYNVEQGITNDLFPHEREELKSCYFNATPESSTHYEALDPIEVPSDVVKFAVFMRLLAAPTPAADTDTVTRGRKLFGDTGCAFCHTPTLHTGKAVVASLRNKEANLYSDLVLHNMGTGLADDVSQGAARGDEFRTAPLWGLGKRVFFLHDGRTKDLLEAIQAHASGGNGQYAASEANQVIAQFNRLNEIDKQHLLNFLRSL